MRIAVVIALDHHAREPPAIGCPKGKFLEPAFAADETFAAFLLIVPVRRTAISANLVRHALDVAARNSGDTEESSVLLHDSGQRMPRLNQGKQRHVGKQ